MHLHPNGLVLTIGYPSHLTYSKNVQADARLETVEVRLQEKLETALGLVIYYSLVCLCPKLQVQA